MFTPYTGYNYYVCGGVKVQAVQLTIYNLKHVSEWIRAHGGATAGMLVIDSGEICRRGIWLGTLTGDVDGAGERDWMIRGPYGFNVCPWEKFDGLYQPVTFVPSPLSSLHPNADRSVDHLLSGS